MQRHQSVTLWNKLHHHDQLLYSNISKASYEHPKPSVHSNAFLFWSFEDTFSRSYTRQPHHAFPFIPEPLLKHNLRFQRVELDIARPYHSSVKTNCHRTQPRGGPKIGISHLLLPVDFVPRKPRIHPIRSPKASLTPCHPHNGDNFWFWSSYPIDPPAAQELKNLNNSPPPHNGGKHLVYEIIGRIAPPSHRRRPRRSPAAWQQGVLPPLGEYKILHVSCIEGGNVHSSSREGLIWNIY